MEPIHNLVKVHVPNYLTNLPLPNSIGGWFRLSIRDWANLVPFLAVVGGASYATLWVVRKPKSAVNPNIKKEENKVVDIINIEDLGEKTSLCRCWRSAKFPYCDGAHGAYNKASCDNVGPVVIKRNES